MLFLFIYLNIDFKFNVWKSFFLTKYDWKKLEKYENCNLQLEFADDAVESKASSHRQTAQY